MNSRVVITHIAYFTILPLIAFIIPFLAKAMPIGIKFEILFAEQTRAKWINTLAYSKKVSSIGIIF